MKQLSTGTRRFPLRGVVTITLLLACAMVQGEDTLRASIQTRVEAISAGETISVGDTALASRILLPAFYAQRNYAPAWVNPESVDQLLGAIESVEHDGLNPVDYHLDIIRQYREHLRTASAFDPVQTAEFDLLLTDSLVRLGYHLSFGKVDPEALDSNWNMVRYIDNLDELLLLGNAIDSGHVTQLVEKLRPQSARYEQLRTALSKYRIYQLLGGWQPVPAGKTLETGMTGERVLALRARLIASGDLSTQDMFLPTFDDAVAAGVKRFQLRHGLHADGRAGRRTLREMNIPVEARVDQIRANLERARWVLHDLPDTYIMVDIAGFNARFYRDDKLVWESRAQVGRPARESPVFRSKLKYLDINPTWTVPPTILDEDVLPEVRANRGYLAVRDMDVLDYKGKLVDPNTIDWDAYTGKNFPYLIRQQPGPNNALGRIKFMFPNRHSVYLHDTPSKSLFDKPERAFSSGCVRIERPYELAELLLADNDKWNHERLMNAINSYRTRTVNLVEPVTIIMLYWTVAVNNDGSVHFSRDIYDRDRPIISGLNEGFRFRTRDIIRYTPEHTALLNSQ
ncbi:MAG: L,D-transpeptidase family protein [Gammaproteobacteria bacterium]|nr:L,D-transpeptidase family protein [Gammaproteobacteria bacterium]